MEKLVADLKAHKHVAGAKQVNRLLAENGLQRIYLANDCDLQFAANIKTFAKKCGVAVIPCGTRAEIAKACSIEVPCAVVGILK